MANPGDMSKRAQKSLVDKTLARMHLPWFHSRQNATTDYQYKPLKDPLKETRIVILQPGRFEDEIRLSFDLRRLESNHPDYEALSYVWGTQDNPSLARIIKNSALDNKGAIPIGRNLDIAIRHLRYEHKQRYLWIDALCINQQDTTERSQQVSLMAKIYSRATTVTIWLGSEEDDSDKALDLLRFLSEKVELSENGYFLRPLRNSGEPEWGDQNVPLPFRDGELNPVAALFGRPYFKRVWVQQEIALAESAVVKVGRKELPWDNFRTGAMSIARKHYWPGSVRKDHRESFAGDLTFSVLPLCKISRKKIGYNELRDFLQNTICEDPRDRIYASLSLLRRVDQRLGIIPDYSMTVEELYTHVARRYYATQFDLGLLESCELSTKILDIPSWVPDFSSRSHITELISSKWSACAWISAQYTPIGSGLIGVVGVSCAKVEQIFHLFDTDSDGESDWRRKTIKTIYKLKPPRDLLPIRFASRQSELEAHCRAFVCDKLADSFERPGPNIFPDIAQCVKGLEFLWFSEKSWEEQPLSNILPEQYLHYCHQHFVGRCFVRTGENLFGLAPPGTQEGDLICVLLGCRFPIVLRPVASSGPIPQWQVVGHCYIHGLMNGEAIYGARMPERLRPVYRENVDPQDLIDEYPYQLFDTTDRQKFWSNPATILTELAGIKAERYERKPHLLEVLPETLRAAGAPLQEFTLV